MENSNNQKDTRKNNRILTFAAAGAVALGCFLFAMKSAKPAGTPGATPTPAPTPVVTPTPPAVKTITLEKTTFVDNFTIDGVVESNITVKLNSNVSDTTISRVLVKEGDLVQKGQVIARLDTAPIKEKIEQEKQDIEDEKARAEEKIETAQTDKELAKIRLDNANKELAAVKAHMDRAKKLYDTAVNTVSIQQEDYDKALKEELAFRETISNAVTEEKIALEEKKRAEKEMSDATIKNTDAEIALEAAKSQKIVADENVATATAEQATAQDEFDTIEEVYITAEERFKTAQQDWIDASLEDGKLIFEKIYMDAKEVYENEKVNYEAALAKLESANNNLNNAINQQASATEAVDKAEVEVATSKTNLDNANRKFDEKSDRYIEKANATASAEAKLTSYTDKTNSTKLILDSAKNNAKFDYCKLEYESAKATYDSRYNSLNISRLETDYTKARIKLEKAEKDSEKVSDGSRIKELTAKLDECTIVATEGGIITDVKKDVGDSGVGTVAVLQSLANLKITAKIPESEISYIRTGTTCKVSNKANDRVFTGTFTFISPVAEPATTEREARFPAEITVAADSGLQIGMTAQAEIVKSRTKDVFMVPQSAIATDTSGRKVIYIQDEENRFEFTPATVVCDKTKGGKVVIKSDLLQPGINICANAEDMAESIQ